MNRLSFFIFAIFIVVILFSCNREDILTNAELDFSVDTVMFDTVFTTIGSTTKILTVYNRNDKNVVINKLKLAGGKSSCYRLNIDGIANDEIEDYEIKANDSIFIFVEVTITPNRNKMIEQDSIVFIINQNMQDVDLVSFGQDVNLINGEIIKSQTWNKEKPYLIYNSVMLDTLEVLQIESGTQIYSHRNSTFIVKGSLIVNGTLEEPVVFQADRLEDFYQDVPGQWNGIYLTHGSHDNYINFAEIKNAVIGITIDTVMTAGQPNLTLLNSKILTHSIAGIYAKGTHLVVANSIIADCGIYSVACVYGGTYYFYNSTIDNHWKWGTRQTPALVLNNYVTDTNKVQHFWGKLEARFINTIISGSLKNEFVPDAYNIEEGMELLFINCYVEIDPDLYNKFSDVFTKSIINANIKYKSVEKFDFNLDTLSPVKDKADVEIINLNYALLHKDIEGKDRLLDSKPDIGALERQE